MLLGRDLAVTVWSKMSRLHDGHRFALGGCHVEVGWLRWATLTGYFERHLVGT